MNDIGATSKPADGGPPVRCTANRSLLVAPGGGGARAPFAWTQKPTERLTGVLGNLPDLRRKLSP